MVFGVAGAERKDETVESQLEEPLGVVVDSGALHAGQPGKVVRGEGLLRLAVICLAAATSPPRGRPASASA